MAKVSHSPHRTAMLYRNRASTVTLSGLTDSPAPDSSAHTNLPVGMTTEKTLPVRSFSPILFVSFIIRVRNIYISFTFLILGTFTYEAWLASPICAGTATATFGPVAPSVCTEITDTLAAQALKCTDTSTCFLVVYPIGLNTPTSGASTSVLASGAALLATGAAAALLL